jgi:ketosteroid isomerase-like protein
VAEPPTDNVALLRERFGAEGETRRWGMAELRAVAEEGWHPDVVYEEAAEWPGAGTFHGREAVLARFAEYQEILGAGENEVVEIVEFEPGRVFLTFRYHTESSAGMPVDHHWAYLFEVRDGLVVRWKAYLDADAARRELGVEDRG